MASNSEKIGEASSSLAVAAEAGAGAGSDPNKTERVKATRHPRWTRQETIVLIEAKKMVESGEQPRFKSPNGVFNQTDPKWDMVSSLCQNQGVKRGPVQCRKRWGNLLTDFRKIKKYEACVREEGDSFWMMRNDRRKENKLPGFFDEVVFRVLDGGVLSPDAYPLNLVKMAPRATHAAGGGGNNGADSGGAHYHHHHHLIEGVELLDDDEDEDDDEVEGDDDGIADSEKKSWSNEEENNKFFESNTSKNVFMSPTAFAKQSLAMRENLKMTPSLLGLPTPPPPGFQREPMPREGHKRRRSTSEIGEGTSNISNNILKVMRRNTNIMKAYLGAQNMHHQLTREQLKEQTDSIVAALDKLTDAVNKIAEKL